MIGNGTLSAMAMLLGLVAVLALVLAWYQLRRAETMGLLLEELLEQTPALSARMEAIRRERVSVATMGTSTTAEEASWRPMATAPSAPAPISELDRAVARVNDPLSVRLEMLGRWERAAGIGLAEISPVPAQWRHRNRELADAQSLAQVGAAEQEIGAAWPELLRALAGRTDRDLDPRRENQPLQTALAELLRDFDVLWIDPAPGTPFQPREQLSLGVSRPGTAAEAGTVAEVRCRGLRSAGTVLLRAEVLEFG